MVIFTGETLRFWAKYKKTLISIYVPNSRIHKPVYDRQAPKLLN